MKAQIYTNDKGQYHREDGPAIIWSNGSKFWYINGNLHREDGPAIIYSDGQHHWFINGFRHREDGPAVLFSDGSGYFYLNDTFYTKNTYYMELYKMGKITEGELFLHLL